MKYNFAKLLQDGGQIRKYQTASGGGVTYRSPISDTWNDLQNWRNTTNASYENVYRNMYIRPDFDMDEYNTFLGRYYDLMRGSKYKKGDGAVYYQGTHDYQKDFDKKGFHTNEFQNGWEHVDSAYTGDWFNSDHTWGGGDEYVGWTTANRYANSWNDAELARENAIAKPHGMIWVPDERAEGLETNDGRKFYKLAKLAPEQPELAQPENNPQENPQESSVENPVEEQPENPEDLDNIPELGNGKQPWTDWIPLSAQVINDLVSARRQAALQKRMRFPLEEVPYIQHKVTNDYHLRTGMEQNANDLRTVGAYRSNSSDMRTNLDNMNKYDAQAAEIENQAEQHKADTTFKERSIAEEVANTNRLRGVAGANKNILSNVAAWNNIIDANRRWDLAKTQAMNSYIGNMATSYGKYVLDEKLNNLAFQRGLNEYKANLEQQQAYNDFYGKYGDFTKTQAYKDFAASLDAEDAGERYPELDSKLLTTPETREEYIKELWDSDYGKAYRDRYNKEMTAAEQAYVDKWRLIANKHAAKNLQLPNRVNNQGFVPWSFAKGGSVRSRYIDWQEHVNKEQQEATKNQHKRNELSTRKLTRDLDRLSREQMILLRSVFK